MSLKKELIECCLSSYGFKATNQVVLQDASRDLFIQIFKAIIAWD